ncbi:sialoadhesin-like [Channa argus]|uniref:sialoadhesin-like n=1 Tax=Channa argus TaxID=215402 RepID=UPI00351F811A
MSLTAAVNGFVLLLLLSLSGTVIVIVVSAVLCVTVIQGQNNWGVTYTDTHICVLEGSTVDITCTYTYPSRINGRSTTVQKKSWFTEEKYNAPVDLRTDPNYTGRVKYYCPDKVCTLRIRDVRQRDSAVYKFRFITNQPGRYTGEPGVTLSVTDLQVLVITSRFSSWADVTCQSSCLSDHLSYIWYKNGQEIQTQSTSSYGDYFTSADSISCAVKGHEKFPSPSVYPPQLPSVSVSPSAEIVEGSSVNLTCSSDANPAANYTWYKNKGNLNVQPLNKELKLVFSSIQSSDSGLYYCEAENELGRSRSEDVSLNVKYSPQLPSVSVSPSAEIVEGSSVTLTCSSDANPAANYTWYKENEDSPKASGQIFTITDFRPENSGNYSCEAQNTIGRQNSTLCFIALAGRLCPLLFYQIPNIIIRSSQLQHPSLQHREMTQSSTKTWCEEQCSKVSLSPSMEIDEGSSLTVTCSSDANPAAKYTCNKAANSFSDPPKLPSVSVSPSAEIVEGSSVTLTCSSDANPAANYTWYKMFMYFLFTLLRVHASKFLTGTTMSLKAAASGFLIFILVLPGHENSCSHSVVIQGQNNWGVTYTATHICVLEGSTVDITCTYTYPSRINGRSTTVQTTSWFTKEKDNAPVDLRTDPDYTGRVKYYCPDKVCTLRMRDVRQRDSAVYKFRFITNQPGSYTDEPGVTLSVTDLQVQVTRSKMYHGSTWADVTCQSSCLSDHLSYIWYKNGQKIQRQSTSSYEDHFTSADSISCAVKGHEKFPSPSVCVRGESCNRVIYTDRRICAVKGSSVDISCTYTSYYQVKSKFWFSPERSRQWQNLSQPEDLSKDSQYSGRVQVFETETGGSTLRITDLRDTDSAQYHFKFITWVFEWRSSLPGTTLTVTDPDLQVIVRSFSTWTKLKCHSSCRLPVDSSYIWYKNGEKMRENREEISIFPGNYYTDSYSCAVKGHEDCPSPSVYPPKLPSVSVSPSAEIVEGSSVTLTCSSDANPAANYTWYKENEVMYQGPEGIYHFTSISSEDRGIYYCKSENEFGWINSSSLVINVLYPPQLPSVSVSPSAEIVEGSSVNLTCSSDANPAANYTWYKENEDSPKASGQIFTITDFRPEHSENYYCEAQNTIGRQTSDLYFIVQPDKSVIMMNIIRLTLVVLMLIPLLIVSLWMRKKKTLKLKTEQNEHVELTEM